MITICGPMRKIDIMIKLASILKDKTGYDSWVTIPDDVSFSDCSDLIQHRADYLDKIVNSRLVIVVGEWVPLNEWEAPAFIIPNNVGYPTISNAIYAIAKGLGKHPDDLECMYLGREEPFEKKTIGESVKGFIIGESTSYEMMWALRHNVPVLLLKDSNVSDYLVTEDSDLILPFRDRIFRCYDL